MSADVIGDCSSLTNVEPRIPAAARESIAVGVTCKVRTQERREGLRS